MAGSAGKFETRENKLRRRIEESGLPAREFRIFSVLLRKEDWTAGKILDRFQPRSLEALARECHVSKATLCRGLSHLQRHGWVERFRHVSEKGIGGRGHFTRYVLLDGKDCDCFPEPGNCLTAETDTTEKLSHQRSVNCLTLVRVSPGQGPVSAKGVRDREEVGRESSERESERSEVGGLTQAMAPRLSPDSFWHQSMNKLYDEERP